jgi:hypothetical protein
LIISRYSIIFRPTSTLEKMASGAGKRVAIIWLLGVVYQLVIKSIDYLPVTFSTAKIIILTLCIVQPIIIFIIPLFIITISYYKTYDLLMLERIPSTCSYNRTFVRQRSAKRLILFAFIFPIFWLPFHISLILRTALYPNITPLIVYFSHFSFIFANFNFILCPLLLCYICRNSWA